VAFDEVLNSGTAPYVDIVGSIGGGSISVEGLQLSSVGSNVFEFTCNATTTGNLLFMNAVTATNFQITNLSVKDADTDWMTGDGVISGGSCNWDGTQSARVLYQSAGVGYEGRVYKFEVKNYSAGNIRVRPSVGVWSNTFTANGIYEFIVDEVGQELTVFDVSPGFIGSIDNISVHKLTFQKEIAESTNYTGTYYVLPVDENNFLIPVDYVTEGIVAQVFGGETNDTTGFVAANNAVLSSVETSNEGEFAIQIESNTTPTADADCDIDITVANTTVHRLSVDWRHIGTGLDWLLQVEGVTVATRAVGDTTYAEKIYYYTTADTTTTIRFMENNVSNNGGVIFDNLSLKPVTFP
ncbi:hypothetical protein LCGC14_1707390, partial [marine sediment metagenome]